MASVHCAVMTVPSVVVPSFQLKLEELVVPPPEGPAEGVLVGLGLPESEGLGVPVSVG